MNKYYKNFILTGELDYFCILCNETFGEEAAVERHIRWEAHRKILKLQEYLHKYKKDFIYKIKDVYYCEVCNSTTTDVASHIKDDNHQAQRAMPEKMSNKSNLAKHGPNGIIKVNNKIVSRLEWHGIKENYCSLCNLDIHNDNTHVSSFSHMSNLTQSRVKCIDDNCYRKLKSNKFYCFTCFETFDNEHLTNHWTDKHTNKNVHTGKSENNKSKSNNLKIDSNNNTNNMSIKILADMFGKKYNVDIEKRTAKCLLCDATVVPTHSALEMHIYSKHKDAVEENEAFMIYDHGKIRHELAVYGKDNYIKLNKGGSKAFCSLCDVFISGHIVCAYQHVQGALHRGHLEVKGFVKDSKHKKPPVKPVLYSSFVEASYGPFNVAEYNVMVINNGICVEVLSLALIRVIDCFDGGRRGKCYACDTSMPFMELWKHSKEKEHRTKLMNSKVLLIETDKDTDFIREIHPGLYHCGCCNKVYPFWENMAKHLGTFTHKVQRSKKQLLSSISAKLFLEPFSDLDDIDEYVKLRSLDGIN